MQGSSLFINETVVHSWSCASGGFILWCVCVRVFLSGNKEQQHFMVIILLTMKISDEVVADMLNVDSGCALT